MDDDQRGGTPAVDEQTQPNFGYLSVVEYPEHGYFGGYLIVCAAGRPLEFHCTVPIRPSRAQEILYGPTLRPYLIADQIGKTLAGKAKLTPAIVLVDEPDLLYLGSQLKVPVALLAERGPLSDPVSGAVSCKTTQAARCHVPVGQHHLVLPSDQKPSLETVARQVRVLAENIDVAEPFERIHLAIREAQRIGEHERETDAQAA